MVCNDDCMYGSRESFIYGYEIIVFILIAAVTRDRTADYGLRSVQFCVCVLYFVLRKVLAHFFGIFLKIAITAQMFLSDSRSDEARGRLLIKIVSH